jgi:hypothetical protein
MFVNLRVKLNKLKTMKVKDTCSIKILRGKTGKVISKDGNMRYFVADFDSKGSWIDKKYLS